MVPFSNISLRLSVYFRITSNFNYFLSASISLLFLSFEYVSDTFTSRGLASKWNKILNGKKKYSSIFIEKEFSSCLFGIYFFFWSLIIFFRLFTCFLPSSLLPLPLKIHGKQFCKSKGEIIIKGV